jgi:hypothetical protein
MTPLKWRHIRFSLVIALSFGLMLSATTPAFGQKADSTAKSKYQVLIPDYMKLQYAGGIGFMSVGVGYTFFKKKLDVSMFYGYVPKAFSVTDLHSISLQLTFKFLHYKINDKLDFLPLNFGWYAHHTFGSEFWITLPDKYSDGYYWWSPGRNAGIFLGAELKTKLLATKSPASGTAFYVRVGSRGLYIASKVGNSSIPFTDILELGFGVAIYR